MQKDVFLKRYRAILNSYIGHKDIHTFVQELIRLIEDILIH